MILSCFTELEKLRRVKAWHFLDRYLQQTTIAPKKLENLHFFNSFFFSKLAEDGIGGPAAFERVKKWTRKVNIFEKDFIFIPVNQRSDRF